VTTLLASRTPSLFDVCGEELARDEPVGAEPAGRAPEPVGGEPTLDDLIVGVWEGLTAHGAVMCPVCEGELQPVYAAHARPVAGRCSSCQSALS
jgi:hypothetical protein